ncbi:Helicase C-terminal [Penicillium bovifimosum]|uniref:RNA helicase n=1 Tax=Penicillium bovifimosum TaxID=126998 RepID=A0A9W9GJ09_9EURO|nr:Helicase C-terminal [Penicillium bovifimosum]KAJ5121335.1 Helicase C-terminal [Penicillium bovifimosum]
MQPWIAGSRSLYALRPWTRFATRSFTTTHTLQRSRKQKPVPTDKKKPKSLVQRSASQTVRKDIAAARDFTGLVEATLRDVHHKLNTTGESLEDWTRFERQINNACKLDESKSSAQYGPLRHIKVALQKAYLASGLQGLREEIEYLMYSDSITARFSEPVLDAQQRVADLRWPAEWYPRARSMRRTIHLHVGPTNSGKTYHALQRLAKSKNGFYAGPLRLLAQEVYQRFKADGVPCSLVTGDDVKFPENNEVSRIVSNTVEMVSLGQEYDVGVIDEIQMIANSSRGWAWTRAFLGAQAAELHVCGETRSVPLIRELCALTGDNLEIHRYERLNGLEVMPHSLKGNLHNLEKGDCVVVFSRKGIHAMKADIEKTTGRRAAIVYGGLPAEIRTQQASLFNDPDNDYDFLVASDAIGMGLNLSCKRVIFDTIVKRLPSGLQRLTVPEIKQIGGRAGRYRAANATGSTNEEPNVGLITSLEEVDLPYIQQAMKLEPPPLSAAGIFPPESVFRKFAAYFPPGVPFEYLIKRVLDIAQVNPLFFLCDPSSQLGNAEIIDTVKGLPFEDQLKFMVSPMDRKSEISRDVTGALADCVADHNDGRLLDINHLNLEVLEQQVSGSNSYMADLESLHRAVILYLWLSFRFGGVFTDRTLASHVKELVEERMVRALTEFSANKRLRQGASLKRQIALQKQLLEQQRMGVAPDWLKPSGEGEMGLDLSGEPVSEGAEGVEGTEGEASDSDDLSLIEPSPEAEGQDASQDDGTSADLKDSEDSEPTESYYDTEVHKF